MNKLQTQVAESFVGGGPNLVARFQTFATSRGYPLKVDGKFGPKTARTLWEVWCPGPEVVVSRARAALRWSPMTYSMAKNTGLGESWMEPDDLGTITGDCSDFACFALGVPKGPSQRGGRRWLGTDGLFAGGEGKVRFVRHTLADAMPGDLVCYVGNPGHVEVVVSANATNILTVGVASTNAAKLRQPSGAVAVANKTHLWRRKGAAILRPAWYP